MYSFITNVVIKINIIYILSLHKQHKSYIYIQVTHSSLDFVETESYLRKSLFELLIYVFLSNYLFLYH